MCHYLLSHRTAPTADLPALSGRYADEAIELFLHEIDRHGTRPQEYQAKMFGGGDQFPGASPGPAPKVPRDNIAIGMRLLRRHGFRLADRTRKATTRHRARSCASSRRCATAPCRCAWCRSARPCAGSNGWSATSASTSTRTSTWSSPAARRRWTRPSSSGSATRCSTWSATR
ncbi:chemotaxis protein CheD [Dactylosporangium cerinum]